MQCKRTEVGGGIVIFDITYMEQIHAHRPCASKIVLVPRSRTKMEKNPVQVSNRFMLFEVVFHAYCLEVLKENKSKTDSVQYISCSHYFVLTSSYLLFTHRCQHTMSQRSKPNYLQGACDHRRRQQYPV